MRVRLALAIVLIAFGLMPSAALAAPSVEQQLAERYMPVLTLEPQEVGCGGGEAYRPTSVDVLLGKPDVVLVDPDGKIAKHAPTGPDLFGLGEGYYLDQPGDPLNPGCDYEKNFQSWNAGRKPLVYAHVAGDPAYRDQIAVQYWFFYTFNDFTDKHEGDWEMAEVAFDAPTPEGALQRGPYAVGLAQHAGGERADWNGSEVKKDGTHPVLFVATGSHATYFGQATYLGRGASEGFGCDDTSDATLQIHPQTQLLPEVPDHADAPFSWLAFQGRWGQKEKGINNGPTGPAAKSSWSQPIDWLGGLRDTSLPVPEASGFGISVTDFFCGAVTQGSIILNWALVHPVPFVALLGLLVVGSGAAVRRTAWRPVEREPLRMERRGGQILRTARRVYWSDLRTFLGMGAIFIPISVVAASIQWVLFHLTRIAPLIALDGRDGAVTAFIALLIGGVGAAIASTCTTAAVAAALGELEHGRQISAADAFRMALHRWRALAGALARQFGAALVLTLVIVGIPFAIRRFIRWSLFAQTTMLEGESARGALRRSAELVDGHWWRTFGITVLIDVLAALSGPLIGVLLLLLTDNSLNFINLVGALIYTITVPYAALALTLYYFDLDLKKRETDALPG
ncbi:MAG TPA: hypothetical protein VH817_17895 [Thermoleophilaceae bacterium]